MNNDKNTLRKKYLEKRNEIPFFYKKEASIKAFLYLKKNVLSYKNILSFFNKKEELDLSNFNMLLAKEQKLFLPKIENDFLSIYRVKNPKTDLTLNQKIKIYEPNPAKCNKVDLDIIDCVLVPGVVFDKNNHRLGFGKGFYDKLLAKMPNVETIGLGFKDQFFNGFLPVEKQDIELKKVFLF